MKIKIIFIISMLVVIFFGCEQKKKATVNKSMTITAVINRLNHSALDGMRTRFELICESRKMAWTTEVINSAGQTAYEVPFELSQQVANIASMCSVKHYLAQDYSVKDKNNKIRLLSLNDQKIGETNMAYVVDESGVRTINLEMNSIYEVVSANPITLTLKNVTKNPQEKFLEGQLLNIVCKNISNEQSFASTMLTSEVESATFTFNLPGEQFSQARECSKIVLNENGVLYSNDKITNILIQDTKKNYEFSNFVLNRVVETPKPSDPPSADDSDLDKDDPDKDPDEVPIPDVVNSAAAVNIDVGSSWIDCPAGVDALSNCKSKFFKCSKYSTAELSTCYYTVTSGELYVYVELVASNVEKNIDIHLVSEYKNGQNSLDESIELNSLATFRRKIGYTISPIVEKDSKKYNFAEVKQIEVSFK